MTLNKIIKRGEEWFVYSEDEKKKLGGPYSTEAQASARLKQVEHFSQNLLVNILCNLSPKVRHDRIGDRKYLVVPMVMLTEGVHAGSNGPLLYPADELKKTPEVWNHKPIVVYHPAGTACDPVVLSSRGVGMIMSAKWDDGKLKAEAWLEEDRLGVVDNRVKKFLDEGKMMEISTGLFSDFEMEEGEWRGKKYTAIAHNYRPDHLAILPDQTGACSIADGGGLLRNSQTEVVLEGVAVPVERITQYRTADGKVVNLGQGKENTMDRKEFIDGLIKNEANDWKEEDREFLDTLKDEQLQKLEVKNAAMPPALKKKKKDEEEEEEEVVENDTPVLEPKSTTKNENKEVTVEEYVQNAPPDVRDMLTASLAAHQAQKDAFIKVITANAKNRFTKEFLASQPVAILQGLAEIAAPEKSNTAIFSGMGEVIGNAAVTETPLELPTVGKK